ncbi:hypothetical protein SSS_05355 [Sarcoptes scabiei]|nr:hypothetical protein SSS_05355 [Sarcoptes scabiei]
MMESPKLSLTASFDDLCRFQNSISYNEKTVIDLNFKVVKDIVHKLPVAKRDTLAFLMIHLRKVLKNSNVNFVTKENLVEVFAPLVIDFATLTDKNQIKHEKIISSLTMKTLLSISSDFWIQLTSTQSISTLDSDPIRNQLSFSVTVNHSDTDDDENNDRHIYKSPCAKSPENMSVYATPVVTGY